MQNYSGLIGEPGSNTNQPTPDILLLRGECLRALAETESEIADAVVTDSPYSSGGLHKADRNKTVTQKYISSEQAGRYADFPGDNRDQRSFMFWCTMWLTECYRIMKPGAPICLFTDWRQLPLFTDLLQAGGFTWGGIMPWDKTEGARPALGAFRAQCEYIVWGHKGQLNRDANPVALPGFVRKSVVGATKVHPTEKPLELMRQVVKICPPGGLVLDPFAGGGTTGVACQKEGRRFLGFEYTAHYHALGAQRLLHAETNPELLLS